MVGSIIIHNWTTIKKTIILTIGNGQSANYIIDECYINTSIFDGGFPIAAWLITCTGV